MKSKPAKESLRQRFISLIEQRILSGEYKVGQKLPPEREISEQTGISRTIVRAGLIELAAKKVLTVAPRKGTYVSDFHKDASLELYNALTRYAGKMDGELLEGLTEYREIIETAAAALAAQRSAPEDVDALRELLARERAAQTPPERTELDYLFHLRVSAATQNVILPMAMRSIETLYKSQVLLFYESGVDPRVVYEFHEKLISALHSKDAPRAHQIVKDMLDHGKNTLAHYYKAE